MNQPPAHGGGGQTGSGGVQFAAAHGTPAPGFDVVLVTGNSQTTRASFVGGVPPAQTVLGSAPEVGWRIVARGVEPRHAELAWDGQQLWVRDAGSTYGTYVGVERIDAWRPLVAGDRVTIGEAAFTVMRTDSAPLQDEFDPLDEESTRVARATTSDDGPQTTVYDLNALPTAAAAARSLPRAPSTAETPRATGPDPFASASTVITESPHDMPGTPQPSAAIRAMGIPPPRVSRPTPGGLPVPPPRIGGTSPPGAVVLQRADESTVAISNESAGGPVVTPFVGPDAASSPRPNSVPPHSASPRSVPAPGAPATVVGASLLAAVPLPTVGQMPIASAEGADGLPHGELTSMFGVLPPPAAPGAPTRGSVEDLRSGLAALPPRTLVLLGVTLLAGAAMLVIVFRAPPDASSPTHPTTGHASPAVAPIAPDARAFTPPLAGPAAGPMGTLLSATTAPPPMPAAPGHGHAPSPPSPDAVAGQAAAAALASGHLDDALARYRALAIAHPETPVYGQFVQILMRKLEAQAACPPGSTTCTRTVTTAPSH